MPINGMSGKCELIGRTSDAGYSLLQFRSSEVSKGFSGAPVWDDITGIVLGMVTSLVPAGFDPEGRQSETFFCTPTETLQTICAALRLTDICPYRSLQAFVEADAQFFYGRQRVIKRLLASLRRQTRFLAAIGPSGCGKSSLVQAGLIPALRAGALPGSDNWDVIVSRPGDNVFVQLATQGLSAAGDDLGRAVERRLESCPDRTRLVIVIDQFEELLVTCPESVRQEFVAQAAKLLDSASPVTLIITLRDDFYSSFTQQAISLLGWLEDGLVNVPATLEQDEVSAIIEEPAHFIGVKFEVGLAQDILRDATVTPTAGGGVQRVAQSTALPLLEFALTQVWERRENGLLTHAAYDSIGGVTGGLVQWADRVFLSFPPNLRPLARRILVDLVNLGDSHRGLPDSRRRRMMTALSRDAAESESVQQVVQRLAAPDARLVVTARDPESGTETVELIHDAIIGEWGRVQRWLRDDRRFLAWRQELETRAGAWTGSANEGAHHRDDDMLLRGRGLLEAEEWLRERGSDLGGLVTGFIHASLDLRERERLARERSRQRALGALGLGLATAIVLASLAAVGWQSARVQAGIAQDERYQAFRASLIAHARQLAAQAQGSLAQSPERALLLAVEAVRSTSDATLPPDRLAEAALRLSVYSSGGRALKVDTWSIYALAFSPDGQWLATAGQHSPVRLWAVGEPAAEPLTLTGGEKFSWALTFSPDGRWLAAGNEDGTVQLWTMAKPLGEPQILDGFPGGVRAMAFSPDSQWLAAGSAKGFLTDAERTVLVDGSEQLWALKVPTAELVERRAHMGGVHAVAFSPDGQWLAVRNADESVESRSWNRPVTQSNVLVGAQSSRALLAFSPDARWLVGGSDSFLQEEVRLWPANALTAEPLRLRVGRGEIYGAFSADGRWLAAVAGSSPTARLWPATDPTSEPRLLNGQASGNSSLAFGPDGRWLAIGGNDGIMRLWATDEPQSEPLQLLQPDGRAYAAVFSPDGEWLATASSSTVRLWPLKTNAILRIACSTANRNLSPEEWQQYFDETPYRPTCPAPPIP
jgi:WD40 repeat protein